MAIGKKRTISEEHNANWTKTTFEICSQSLKRNETYQGSSQDKVAAS